MFFEARVDIRLGLCVDDVPHLRFAALAMHTVCHLVIGMHLNAEVVCSVNELQQNGQLVIMLLCHYLAEHGFGHLAYHLCQGVACPCAVSNHGWRGRHCRHLPTLADMVLQGQLFPCGQVEATPHLGVEVRFEEHGVKLGALCFDHTTHGEHAHIGDGVQFV